jgi:hypothetical protein
LQRAPAKIRSATKYRYTQWIDLSSKISVNEELYDLQRDPYQRQAITEINCLFPGLMGQLGEWSGRVMTVFRAVIMSPMDLALATSSTRVSA